MSLARFSSETAGHSSDQGLGADPSVGSLSVVRDDDGAVDDAFELALKPGLDNFDPNPSELAASGRVDGASQGLPLFVRETTEIEPARAAPSQNPQTTKAVSAVFIRTSILGFDQEQPAGSIVIPKARPPAPAPEIPRVVAAPDAKTPPRENARPKPRQRWRPHVSMQTLMLGVLMIGGALEAGWIGLRISRTISERPAQQDAAGAAALPAQVSEQTVPQRQVAGTSGAPSRVQSSSATPVTVGVPASVRARPSLNPRAPVWVLISTQVPVEILEGGRRVGTSWGGGLRLAPGTHDLLIVNRATGVDAHHIVDIVPGKGISLAVQLVEGRLHVETRLSE
jgi:hypothetical protein